MYVCMYDGQLNDSDRSKRGGLKEEGLKVRYVEWDDQEVDPYCVYIRVHTDERFRMLLGLY